jgi:protein-tyrosine phosphatase
MMINRESLVDFHNHVIPGVDDGASDDVEATAALRAFADQGVHRIIATPHLAGSLTRRPDALAARLEEIDAGWARLEAIVMTHFEELRIYRGVEVMLDTPEPVLDDARLRLAGTSFALVEYPYMMVPPHSTGVLRTLLASGVTPIIAHPERYAGITRESRLPAEWRETGALLQVNAGSITGRYGGQARANALALLESGLVAYVCSDFHARGRPSTAGAGRILRELGGDEQADLLIAVNPRRLLDGHSPLPVPSLRQRKGMLNKLKKWLR